MIKLGRTNWWSIRHLIKGLTDWATTSEKILLTMAKRREIDDRDVDKLLSALTDLQIAELFGMTAAEVSKVQKRRRDDSH